MERRLLKNLTDERTNDDLINKLPLNVFSSKFKKEPYIHLIRNIQYPQQTFVLMKTSWRRIEDLFRLRLQKTSSRRLDQDEYVHLSLTSLEDAFKTSSRYLGQDQYIDLGHMSSRRLQDVFKYQDVFKTSCKNVFKKSSRNLQDVFKTFSRRVIKLICSS